jgi:hypothetical protein
LLSLVLFIKKKIYFGSTGLVNSGECFLFISSACFSFIDECGIIFRHGTYNFKR